MRYAIAVAKVPAERPPVPAPSLYEAYKELLEVGTAQRGAVIPSRLWRAGVLGDLHIFRGAPSATLKIKASAVLLWDWSGSQNAYKGVLITGLTAITQALSQLRFKVWAGAYAGNGNVRLEATPPDAALRGCLIGTVKGWSDSFDARRVATLEDMPGGGTPTGPALQYIRRRVLPFTGDGRKTLLILATDGQADNIPYQQAEVKRLASIPDVTLVTIYCGQDSSTFATMREQFPHCFWAPDRNRIPDAFAHSLRALRGGL